MELPEISDNTVRLRVLLEAHDLKLEDAAEMIGVSRHTMASYRSRKGLVIPSNLLELLELKLNQNKK